MKPEKFYKLAMLAKIIAREKRLGHRVGLANGGFDLLHVGHVRYLQQAKAEVDVLIVALNSDDSLRQLKGSNRALIDEKGRVVMISALACVDYVTLFDELKVDQILLALRPDFHCKGSDYSVDTVPERDVVKQIGGQILIVGGEKVRSTSTIIKSIKALYG